MTTPNTPDSNEALLPCPFCGSSDLGLSNGYDEDANWVVVCHGCKSSGTFCVEKPRAIMRWNTRCAATEGNVARVLVQAEAWVKNYDRAIPVLRPFETRCLIADLLRLLRSRASVAAVEGDAWLPIETCPKTGVNFLACSPASSVFYAHWANGVVDSSNYYEDAGYQSRHATHWQPLPNPVGPAASSPAPASPKFVSEVDQWKNDLTTAGWVAETALNWRAPDGSLWRGPAGAWKELQRRNAAAPAQPLWADKQWSSVDNWPLPDVLNRLADAKEHLLRDHDCDQHGHETVMYAAQAARRHVALLTAPAPAQPEGEQEK